MQFGLESLGRWTDPVETVIERDGTVAYAAHGRAVARGVVSEDGRHGTVLVG